MRPDCPTEAVPPLALPDRPRSVLAKPGISPGYLRIVKGSGTGAVTSIDSY